MNVFPLQVLCRTPNPKYKSIKRKGGIQEAIKLIRERPVIGIGPSEDKEDKSMCLPGKYVARRQFSPGQEADLARIHPLALPDLASLDFPSFIR